MTRKVSPVPPPRLDLSAVPPAERQQAIDAAAGRHPSGCHEARKITPSAALTRCHECGHVDSTDDQGQAMDRHVDTVHAGAGGSSMVLDRGQR